MSVLSIGLSLIKVAGVAGRTVLYKIYENMVNTNWEDHTRNWEDIQ
jgi:hypothetical protein